jgi:hypothetical protein
MSNWKETLAAIAPTVATAIGGPMAGMAVKMAASALGVEESPEALEKAIVSGDPEVMLKLKQAEQDFIVKLKELDYKIEELHQKDRSSARTLFSVNKWPQIVLSSVFITGYFIVLSFIMFGEVSTPDSMQDVVVLLLGILTREVPTIMQFWFGSSSGSKDKAVELTSLNKGK